MWWALLRRGDLKKKPGEWEIIWGACSPIGSKKNGDVMTKTWQASRGFFTLEDARIFVRKEEEKRRREDGTQAPAV